MVTIVMPYYENGGILDRHLTEWQSYAPHVKKNFRAVIVDDGSEKDPAVNHMRNPGFPVELYRIKENIPWNIPGARNLGMHVAPEDWCLLTDIDHVLYADQAPRFFDGFSMHDSRAVFNFQREWADGRPLHPHPNSYLIYRSLYWKVGGTDEDFSGYWGAGEGAFRKALALATSAFYTLPIYLTHFGRDDIPDASTREWGRRGSKWDYNNNPELVKKARGPAYKPVNPLRFAWEKTEWR